MENPSKIKKIHRHRIEFKSIKPNDILNSFEIEIAKSYREQTTKIIHSWTAEIKKFVSFIVRHQDDTNNDKVDKWESWTWAWEKYALNKMTQTYASLLFTE